MFSFIPALFASVLSKLLHAFFTEKIISKIVIELLRRLSKKTSNTIDDMLVDEVSANLNK